MLEHHKKLYNIVALWKMWNVENSKFFSTVCEKVFHIIVEKK